MARRRSRNRRASRKSLNITELDEDSEHIDTHDALWWKNIEADMTVRQSRRLSYAETTSPILDGSSFVEASELRDDWWKTLGRPSIDPSRRVSVRRSVRGDDTRHESSDSENSDEIDGRKSRTSRVRRSANKVAGVSSEPTIIGDSQEAESPGRDEARETRIETSVDTSDAVPSSRPKPFKKRFAKIPDGTFDEFGNEAAVTKNAVASSRGSQERRRADASVNVTWSRSAVRVDEAEGLEATKSPPVMGPPGSVLRRKRRASSIARRLETTSEESEPDAESKTRRLRRKVRKTVSINPFDEVIVEATERSDESKKVSAMSENVEKAERGPSQVGRKSLSQRIEDVSSDKEDENHRDVSSETSHVGTKILEVSLTRMPPGKYRGDGNSRAEKSANERRLRASRSTRPFIEDSAYELPDQERSTTPQISDSDNPKYQSPDKPTRTPPQTPLGTSLASKNLTATSRRSLARSNYSHTKIFSDEDISLEDLSYIENRGNLVMPDIEETRASEKDVPANDEISARNARSDERSRRSAARSAGRSILANKSRLSRESDASTSEDAPEVAGGKNLARPRQDSRGSRASASRKSEVRERAGRIGRTIGKEETEVAEEIDREAAHSGEARLRGNVEVSEEEPNHAPAQDESPASPVERNDLGKSRSEPRNSRPKRELRNGPRRSAHIAESSDEPEAETKTGPSNLSRTRENSRTSGNKSAAGESRRGIMFDESSSEDEEETVERSYRSSGYPDTTEKSVAQKSVAEKSVEQKSVADKSISQKSVAEKSVAEKSVAEKSVAEKSVAEKSVAEKSVAEKSVAEKSVTEKSVAQKSITEKSVAQKSVTEKSVAQKSVTEKSVAQKSVAEKSVTQKSFNSTTRRDSRRGLIQSDVSTSESDSAEESPPKQKSRFKDVSRKSPAPVIESPDGEVPEDEPGEDPSGQLSPRESSRFPARSFSANRSGRRTSIERDESREPEETQNEDPEWPSEAVEKPRASSKRFEDVEAEAVRRSPRSRSSVANSSRQSVRELEKTRQNEKASETPAERSSAALQPSSPSGERTARKSAISSRVSRNILTTSHTSNLRESVMRENWRLASSTPKVAAAADSIIASSKTSTPARAQTSITDFYPSKFLQKSHEGTTPRKIAPRFDPIKMKEVKEKVEEMKRRELEAMSLQTRKDENSKKSSPGSTRKASTKKLPKKATKIVDKAYIVNGKVYRRPKLPRPKPWATDRLYRYLWKRMEPKYKSSTRVESEKFVLSLADVVALTIRRKKYESYKPEVDALVKKMAKLDIIRTLNDFYDFCYDFMPYDFRVKVTPILLPGNKVTIPYDPEKLHTPILRHT